jgi:hypothetical protein
MRNPRHSYPETGRPLLSVFVVKFPHDRFEQLLDTLQMMQRRTNG